MPHDDKHTHLRLRFEVTAERNGLADFDVLRRFIRGEGCESDKEEDLGENEFGHDLKNELNGESLTASIRSILDKVASVVQRPGEM
jgi:hypothetical protein